MVILKARYGQFGTSSHQLFSSSSSSSSSQCWVLQNPSQLSKKQHKQEREWFAVSFKPENFIPGLVIGFIFGLFLDLSKPIKNNNNNNTPKKKANLLLGKQQRLVSTNTDEELKMVLVVRQDLKMGAGKIASQCAHAATGMYSELMQRNKLKEAAENIGLPTFVVADAGRTQVSAGSKTVLAIGPAGSKASVDSITRKLRLL
ncbi:putative peptidyl-tRNA hydrolase 2 [Camellia lanceoleosa]|uniref:Peptidyl-tRNA hydrolase 2 n=1 Tax=Camellia lanceoleosa TaxID=1840588 RepID=A0ACC0G1M8_9ERIC|nr:putative peptidyl-tRNA hydrolase 2 [Camellia lanceoleosa]